MRADRIAWGVVVLACFAILTVGSCSERFPSVTETLLNKMRIR